MNQNKNVSSFLQLNQQSDLSKIKRLLSPDKPLINDISKIKRLLSPDKAPINLYDLPFEINNLLKNNNFKIFL